MSARLGLGNVALASGDLAQAHAASLQFAASADTRADPNLRALARELAVRVALGEDDSPAAEEHARSALAIVDERGVPTVAWRVHATACDVYRRKEERLAPRPIAPRPKATFGPWPAPSGPTSRFVDPSWTLRPCAGS
jgi:hypothetical protein